MSQVKILGLDHRVWWAIFLVMEMFLIAVMIGTLCDPHWVELAPTSRPSLAYQGSLIKIQSGLSHIQNFANPTHYYNVEGYNYERASCGLCFVTQQVISSTTPLAYREFYGSLCSMFTRLWVSAGLFIAFEVLALLALAGIAVIIWKFWTQKAYHFRLAYIASGTVCVSHYVAILAWIGIANVTFGDDCNDLSQGIEPPVVCAESGPKLALFALIFIPFFVGPFCFVTIYLQKQLVTFSRSTITSMDSQRKEAVEMNTALKIQDNN